MNVTILSKSSMNLMFDISSAMPTIVKDVFAEVAVIQPLLYWKSAVGRNLVGQK